MTAACPATRPPHPNGNLATRLLGTGRDGRKTRFHDAQGHVIDATGLPFAPAAALQAVLNRAFGWQPMLPWISLRACVDIGRRLSGNARVIEFGSGRSTIWLARRSAFVHSIESDEIWYGTVRSLLDHSGCHNARLDLRSEDLYSDLTEYEEATFDFALIDGLQRDACVRAVLPKLRPGSAVYLDNVDKEGCAEGSVRKAEEILVATAARRGGRVRYYTDFPAYHGYVNRGLLVEV